MQNPALTTVGRDRAALLKHVRTWHEGPAWITHPEHTDLHTYLMTVAGYSDLEAIHTDITWALGQVNGCY